MLTIKGISEQTGIAESTLRFYRDTFPDFIPCTGIGRRKRYYDDSIAVFQFISECMAKNMDKQDVREQLSERFALYIDNTAATQQQENSSIQTNENRMSEDPNRQLMKLLNNTLAAHGRDIGELKQDMDKLKESNVKLEAAMKLHYENVDKRLNEIREENARRKQSLLYRLFHWV